MDYRAMTDSPDKVASSDPEAVAPGAAVAPAAAVSEPSTTPAVIERISALWHRIHERKLVQWTLAYVGVSLALLHGIELVGHPFHWPLLVTRIVIGLLITGLPIVVILAWYHGENGHQRFTHGEMTIISILLLLGAGMLWVFAKPEADHESQEHVVVGAAKEAAVPAPDGTKSSVAVPASGKLRLAVMPFENLSPDPANAFFTDGMHEEILSTLANGAASLEVISRTTMMLYRATPKSVADIVKELGVTHVLEGSVRREGQEVRFTVQLIDARTDDHVWSHSYDRHLVKSMTLQAEIAADVASQLAVRLLSSAQTVGDSSTDPEAYDLYLKAKLAVESFNPGSTREQMVSAENLLDRALERDLRFASAYLLRARVHLRIFARGHDMSEERLRLVRKDIESARQLIGTTPMIAAVQGMYAVDVEQDFAKALTLFDSAQSAVLSDPEIIQKRAALLQRMGRMDDALAIYRGEVARDPRSPNTYWDLMMTLWAARRPEEAFRVQRFIKNERYPEQQATEILGARMVFAFCGDLEQWRKARFREPVLPDSVLDSNLELLKYEHQFEAARRLVDAWTEESIRVIGPNGVSLISVGRKPRSEVRGWLNLALGNSSAAAEDGRRVLRFVENEPRTPWNYWLLQLLTAEGSFMAGDRERTVQATDRALSMMPRTRDAVIWRYVAVISSRIYAWAGEEDKAVDLIESLVTSAPGLGPAQVTRDPLYSMALATNARYKALEKKLEAEITANRTLL
jgi:TolB-like protein